MFEISGYGSVMDKKPSNISIYERPVFFLNKPIIPQNVEELARPEALREFRSFQKTCAGRNAAGFRFGGALVDRAFTDAHGPFRYQPKGFFVASSGGGFGKVSEVFGFGALWSLWGKGTTYYLS